MDSAGREMRGPSLRILVSIDTLYGPGFAGMQRVAQETCRRLVARGHFVTVLVAGRNDDPLVDEVDGVRVVRYDAEGGAVRAMRASASAAKGIIEGERIDVVHAHFAYSALGPSFAALRAKVPIVRTYHGAWDAEARAERRTRRKPSDVAGDALRYLIELASLRSANAVATLSNYSAEQVRRRFGISHCGLDWRRRSRRVRRCEFEAGRAREPRGCNDRATHRRRGTARRAQRLRSLYRSAQARTRSHRTVYGINRR